MINIKEKIQKYYVYKIQNKINNKIYIGYSNDYKSRWKVEKSAAFNKNSECYYFPISCALRKYGINNFIFQIIEEFLDSQKAFEVEKYWISYYKTNINRYGNKFGYNLTDGGEGNVGFKHSEETKKIISASSKNRKHTKESKTKMSIIQKKMKEPLKIIQEDEIEKFKTLYLSGMTYKEISKIFNCSQSLIAKIVKKLISEKRIEKFKRPKKQRTLSIEQGSLVSNEIRTKISLANRKFSDDEEFLMIELYLSGMTKKEIGKQFNCHATTVANAIERKWRKK